MRCKCCGEDALRPLWADKDGGPWHRCLACGSDSAERNYADVREIYNDAYLEHSLKSAGGTLEDCVAAMATNLDWFGHHAERCPNRDFLDIGCLEGAGLTGMAARGWSVHGFDVTKPPYYGPHVTVAPNFHAGLFPQQYSAVLCREVIEHVEGWRQLVTDAFAVTARGGLFQLQTPRPWHEPDPIPYQLAHLQVFAPMVLRYWLEHVGFTVADYRLWDKGQAWMCRREV